MKVPAIFCSTAILCLALTGCPSSANVTTDYNHNTNFAQFQTFSFADVKTDNPFFEQRIKDEVSRDLQGKGLREVPSGGDLELTAVGAVHNRREYQTFYNNPGFGWYWWGGFGPGYSTTREIHYRVGTLVLDMYDNQSKHLVWRGTAANGVGNSPDKNTGRLNQAIDKLLKNFPPGTNS